MTPRVFYVDKYLTLHQGEAAQTLATLPAGSVQTCVTSPPYYRLRDYGGGAAQIGGEASPGEYVAPGCSGRCAGCYGPTARCG